jgi:hypothetical protein
MTRYRAPGRRQGGATAVEFALGLIVFLTFFLGILDFSRMLWTWGAANEATRWGARTAVVCNRGASVVLARMQKFLPQLSAENLQVDWYSANGLDATCNQSTCTAVNVRIVNLKHPWISPVGWSAGLVIPMPEFSTFLPRESMGLDPDSASVCAAPAT